MNGSIVPRRPRRASQPVFVDRSGRRRRVVIATGATAGVLVVLALSLLVAGLFGASPIPLPGLPDLGGPAPAPPAPVTTAGPDATSGAGSTATPDPSALSATPDPTRRHVPTQTPTDRGRPTRS